MNKELLRLRPKRYLCPYCGEWHEWNFASNLASHDSYSYKAQLGCKYQRAGCQTRRTIIYFEDGICHYKTRSICGRGHLEIDGVISIDEIVESSEEPRVTFSVLFKAASEVGISKCEDCASKDKCLICRLCDENNSRVMHITFGFEFEPSEYFKYADVQKHEDGKATKMKEDTMMTEITKKTSIKSQLWEKSPKENFEIFTAWAEKYKPVLRWAIPVATVYGAYRILNSGEFDLSVNNIADTCEKQLGFKVEFLENRRALKELMVLGGLSAGAYGAMKAVTGILGAKEEKDYSIEEVEAGMNQLESVSKKFAWIQPKTEDMLPIALSVIMVYVALHKPNSNSKLVSKARVLTENIRIRFDTYIELVKLFITDKFKMDLSVEEDQKKLRICGFLVGFMAIIVFLYGKKALEGKKTSVEEQEKPKKQESSLENYSKQIKEILKKVAPTIYTTLFTFLASKKILELEEPFELSEVEQEGEPAEAETEETPVEKPDDEPAKEVDGESTEK